jgi:hypothetical protein
MCVGPPLIPVVPTPAREPTLWLMIVLLLISAPYGGRMIRTMLTGVAEYIGVICFVCTWIMALAASIFLSVYHATFVALYMWRQQSVDHQCWGTSAESAFAHTLGSIEPLNWWYKASFTGFVVLCILMIALLISNRRRVTTVRRENAQV